MSITKGANSSEFVVVHRWLDDNDVLHMRPLVLITDVPETADVARLKAMIDAIGDDFTVGTSSPDEEVDWSKGYKILSRSQWDERLVADVKQMKQNISMTEKRVNNFPISTVRGENDFWVMLNEDHDFMCRLVSYGELIDSLRGEKRVTLRLPLGLHTSLVREANAGFYRSLNSFCIQKLAEAVNYDAGELEEFETSRRKPGRPKKVQDGE